MGLRIVDSNKDEANRKNLHFVDEAPEIISIDCGVVETPEARTKFAGLLGTNCPVNHFSTGYQNRVVKVPFISDRKIHKVYDVPTKGHSLEQVNRLKKWLDENNYPYSESYEQ